MRNQRIEIGVPIDRLLLGDQGGIPAAKYAEMIGAPLWPSTTIAKSPHAEFLRAYRQFGDQVFEDPMFRQTAYFQNALQCIRAAGSFCKATDEKGIWDVAKRFAQRLGDDTPNHDLPIRVRPIALSNCFQLIDGHHRAAHAHARGLSTLSVVIHGASVFTPLQTMLANVLWVQPRHELYQPVTSPEIDTWTLVRRCTDRFARVIQFLREHGYLALAAKTSLDVGSGFGWFVSEMGRERFEAHGIEQDPTAVAVGKLVYPLNRCQLHIGDATYFLTRCGRQFDVVSCLSLLHHFVLGRCALTAEQFIHLIDQATRSVLFLETGQGHEEWFRHSLREWSPDYIEAWLRRHSSFRKIFRLEIDADNVGHYRNNFGRTLFACLR